MIKIQIYIQQFLTIQKIPQIGLKFDCIEYKLKCSPFKLLF